MDLGLPVNKFRGERLPSMSSAAVGVPGYLLFQSQQVGYHNYIVYNFHQPPPYTAQSYVIHRLYGPPTAGDIVRQENTTNSCIDSLSTGPHSPLRGLTTPTKAYAGPNFHSSPAPSSLPVPSFFSKSAPPTPTSSSMRSLVLRGNSPSSSLTRSSSPEVSEAEPHLDKLFRADKEGKARDHCRSAEAASTLAPENRIDKKWAGPRPQLGFDESPKQDSSGVSMLTMDLGKKEPVLWGYERTPPAAITAVANDWESKSMALKSFLDQVQPTDLDPSLLVLPPPSNLKTIASQQCFHHHKSTPPSGKKQTSSPPSPPSPYQSSFSPPRQVQNLRFTSTKKSKYKTGP